MNILIIPTFRRPEMLFLCLEHVAACAESKDDLDIWVCVDEHQGQSANVALVRRVTEKFPGLRITIKQRTPHKYPGNSYNILTAYKEAFNTTAEYVLLVEDDVLIAPDFFRWHYAVQKQSDWFCSIAVKNLRWKDAPTHADPSAYYSTTNDYASLGVCFRRDKLAPIVAHANHGYFADMAGYLAKHFPPSKEFTEQDGLIQRVLAQVKGLTVFPTVPRAQHVGWYGYHRGTGVRPDGTLEERVRQVRLVLNNPEHLRNHIKDPFADVEPYQLKDYPWMTLTEVRA